MHSRDNYHVNLINGHPGGRERHERAKEVLITGEDFLPSQSCGETPKYILHFFIEVLIMRINKIKVPYMTETKQDLPSQGDT